MKMSAARIRSILKRHDSAHKEALALPPGVRQTVKTQFAVR